LKKGASIMPTENKGNQKGGQQGGGYQGGEGGKKDKIATPQEGKGNSGKGGNKSGSGRGK
jgi:hypothetical protein